MSENINHIKTGITVKSRKSVKSRGSPQNMSENIDFDKE